MLYITFLVNLLHVIEKYKLEMFFWVSHQLAHDLLLFVIVFSVCIHKKR